MRDCEIVARGPFDGNQLKQVYRSIDDHTMPIKSSKDSMWMKENDASHRDN